MFYGHCQASISEMIISAMIKQSYNYVLVRNFSIAIFFAIGIRLLSIRSRVLSGGLLADLFNI